MSFSYSDSIGSESVGDPPVDPIPHCPNAAPQPWLENVVKQKKNSDFFSVFAANCAELTFQFDADASQCTTPPHSDRWSSTWSSKLFQTLFPHLVQGLIPCLWGVHGWPSGTHFAPKKKHGNVQPGADPSCSEGNTSGKRQINKLHLAGCHP